MARAERRKGEDPRVGWSGRKGRLGEGDPSTSQGAGGWFGRYFLYFFWLAGLVGERNLSFFLNGNGGESCHFLVLIFVGKKLEGLKKERKIKLKFFLRRLWMICGLTHFFLVTPKIHGLGGGLTPQSHAPKAWGTYPCLGRELKKGSFSQQEKGLIVVK